MFTIHRILATCIASIIAMALVGCGAPSAQALQSTVETAVQSTSQAMAVLTAVAATQVAETACDPQALKQYATEIANQLRAFTQQANLVGATPRVGIGVPLQRLLDLQSEMHKLVPPACLSAYHERVVNMMELHQLAYQNFAGQGDETVTTNLLTMATTELEKVRADLQQINAGTVPSTATPTS